MAHKLLRLPAVIERTGSNINDIYQGMKVGAFPKSVPIGKRTVGWLESEIDAWIEAKVAARDKAHAERRAGGPGRAPVMAEAAT